MKRALGALVVLALFGVGVVAARALTQPSYAALLCRDVDAPYDARTLSRPEIADLDSAADAPKPGRLTTPTARQAREVDGLRTSTRPIVVCAIGQSNQVLLIRRQSQPLNPCYGGAGCPAPRHVWLTCFETLDLRTREHEEPRDCVGYPAPVHD